MVQSVIVEESAAGKLTQPDRKASVEENSGMPRPKVAGIAVPSGWAAHLNSDGACRWHTDSKAGYLHAHTEARVVRSVLPARLASLPFTATTCTAWAGEVSRHAEVQVPGTSAATRS